MKILPSILLSVVLAVPALAQTTYTWVGGSGSWFAASSWSPAGIPGDGDTALIPSGSPNLTRDTTVATVEFGGAALAGDGHLTVTETFTWSAGNLDGRNYAETAALTIAPGAMLHILGEATKGLRGRDIFNDGTILWEGTGNLEVMWSTLLENRSGATFEIRNDATITRSNGTLTIQNDGLLVKSAGTGTSAFSYPYGGFHNLGTVRVGAGTLMLNNGSSAFSAGGDGVFEIEAGATLRFNQATYSFGPGSSVTGEGTLLVTGGEPRLGSASLSGPTIITGGRLRFLSDTAPAELADVELAGPQFSGGRLGGPAVINVNGLFTWTGGYLGTDSEGVINLLGGASAEGDGTKFFANGTLNNAATFTWTGAGNFEVTSSGAFNNLEGATFDIRTDASFTRSNGYVHFVNEGLVVKSAGEGTAAFSVPFSAFNNDGEVRVEAGTLHVNNHGTSSNSTDAGVWIVEEGATLRFGNHQRTLTETASIEGTGMLDVAGATLVNRGTIRPGLTIGTITVLNDYPVPQPEGVLEVEIGGTEAGTEYDVFTATNIAHLGGRLRLALADGFAPTGDETFTVVTALAVQGIFDEVEPPEGYVAEVLYGAQDVAVRLVPVAGCADGLQPDAHTVALYKFDEPLPGTSFDASGNGLNATDDGTTVAEGRFCNARRFNGESDRIDMDVVRDSLQGQTAWTIEYIARSEDGSQVPALVNHACGNGWWLGPRSSTIRFSIKTTAAGGNCLWTVDEASAEAEMDTLWHYYALTWDGDSLRVYRDGAFLDSRPAGGVFLENQTSSFRAWIGHSDSGSGAYTAGLADELRVSDVARSGAELFDTAVGLGFAEPPVSVEDEAGAPTAFALHAPYPNPFAHRATLAFDLPEAAPVRLTVYDVLGREVAVLADGERQPGRHEAVLDAAQWPAGVYFVRMEAGAFTAAQRVTLVR